MIAEEAIKKEMMRVKRDRSPGTWEDFAVKEIKNKIKN